MNEMVCVIILVMQILWMILAALCGIYGFVVFGARSGTLFFAVWFLLAAFFLICALLARFGWPAWVPVFWRRALYVAVAAGVALLLFVEGLVLSHFRESGSPGLDYVIVLGAQVRETGPTVVLRWRLDTAYDYLVANPDTVCIVSGGQGENEPRPEADVMRDYLVGYGIAPERILVENESRNTIENIRNSMKLIDPGRDRVGIVTNDFHMFRACAIAKKQGIRNTQGISAHSLMLFLPNNMLREFAGVMKDTLLGNM